LQTSNLGLGAAKGTIPNILQSKYRIMKMISCSRRDFLRHSCSLGALAFAAGPLGESILFGAEKSGSKMKLGLVTYLWGQDWDLPTLLANCEKAKITGVELRTEHKHGVEPSLGDAARKEVRKRFADSPVTFIGPGTNECFDSTDPAILSRSIEKSKEFIKLSHDCGGSGVKVKPNDFHPGVPHEKTLEQIGQSLNTLGRFAADYGQTIRLEVHGTCAELPNIKRIMDVVTEKNVGACWNCNDEDLKGQGLEYNFNLVKDRLADIAHVRELNVGKYPYQELMNLLVKLDYPGWILLECRTNPKDRVEAMIEQREIWEKMVAKAKA
jgi:sugar phosphate isomerase/epimerase